MLQRLEKDTRERVAVATIEIDFDTHEKSLRELVAIKTLTETAKKDGVCTPGFKVAFDAQQHYVTSIGRTFLLPCVYERSSSPTVLQ